MNKYDQIINMNRPVDTKHPPMSLHNRAAQFAPFDALTGFGGKVYETSRLTQERAELSDDVKLSINQSLKYIEEHISELPQVDITYFIPDKTKDGGSYRTTTARVLKINIYDERLILDDDLRIAFDDIFSLSIADS